MITTTTYDLEVGIAHFKNVFKDGLPLKLFRALNISLRKLHVPKGLRDEVYARVQEHNYQTLQLRPPHLRIPLVNNVQIGKAGNDEEQALCRGGGLLDFDIEHLKGRVFFLERVSYNGGKVIIPNFTHIGNGISLRHGELRLQEGNARFYYSHLSEESAFTSLYVPGRGVIKSTNIPNDVIDLGVQEHQSRLERILLLGVVNREETGCQPVVPGYTLPFYYVKIVMTDSASRKQR